MIQTTQSFEARGPENRVIDVARASSTVATCCNALDALPIVTFLG